MDIPKQFSFLRQKLLDLTMRNQLLNFRPGTRTIEVVDEIPTETYEILVLKEKKREKEMEFLSKPEPDEDDVKEIKEKLQDAMKGHFIWKLSDIEVTGREKITEEEEKLIKALIKIETENTELTEDEINLLWESPSPELEVSKKHADQFLQTNLSGNELQKRLFHINQQARTVLEEQGYNILYLALGFLKWKETPDSVGYRKAPLILIPVELDRKRVKGSFKLRWTGEDIITNISLKARLEEEGIELPNFVMPESKEGIYNYFQDVEKSISPQKSWKVSSDTYLGFFSFTKFVMYQDLNPESWPTDVSPFDNALVKEIFDPSDEVTEPGFNEEEVDLKLSSRDVYHIVDADSSQIAVIEDVKNGHSMVVEGPPGTGKSQTIVNLIAELIANKNTVLFVSEKMAALEVVKSRLDRIGLGEFCLELHSRKSKKKEVLNELERTINNPKNIPLSAEREFNRLEELKSDLNEYALNLHKPFGKIEFTPFHLIGTEEKAYSYFESLGRKLPRFEIDNPENCTLEDWQKATFKLKELSELLKLVKPLSKNPWKNCKPESILPADQEKIESLLINSIKTLKDLTSEIDRLIELSGVQSPEKLQELEDSIESAELIRLSKPLKKEILLNSKNIEFNKADGLIKSIKLINSTASKFKSNVLERNLENLLNHYKEGLNEFNIQNRLFSTDDSIEINIDESIEYLNALESYTDDLVKISGINKPEKLHEIEDFISITKFIGTSKPIEKEVILNPKWNSTKGSFEIIKKIEDFKVYSKRILTRIDKAILNEDLQFLLDEYKRSSSKMLKFLSGDFKRLKNNILSFYQYNPSSNETIISDLKNLLKCQKIRDEIVKEDLTAKSLFGSYWKAEESNPKTLRELSQQIILLRKLYSEGEITDKTLKILSTRLPSKEIDELAFPTIQNKEKLLESLKTLDEYIKFKTLINLNLHELDQELHFYKKKIENFSNLEKNILSLYKKDHPQSNKAIISDLEELLNCQKVRDELRNNNTHGSSIFGSYWNAEESNPTILTELSKWLALFKKQYSDGKITGNALDIISEGASSKEIDKSLSHITNTLQDFIKLIKGLNNFLHFEKDSIFSEKLVLTPFKDISAQLNTLLTNINSLQNWSQYIAIRERNLKTISKNILELIDSDKLEAEDILPCFEGNFADALIRIVFSKRHTLSNFVTDLHENKIGEFQKLDKKLISLNKIRISRKLYKNRPPLLSSASPKSELGILKSEFSRKRGHRPIRQLLTEGGGLIQKIKPCFMMSPLSIAQFLDPQSIKSLKFDYVIFDEASQVKPEDALGAFLRSKKAVIMGDTKQLPPTSFFEAVLDVDREASDDISSIADMESILHLCKRSFPTKMLRWHYRSRHESLIAVSNQEFYDNNLLIYPSPCRDSQKLGLSLVYLPNTIYDRGRSGTNREEAKEVIKAAFKHYQKYGDNKSLGIGTFNMRQQQAILEELELQLKRNPRMEKFFNSNQDEHFFVKNLETIQGDERDVIFVSVGYGFDADNRLLYNFGPLNYDGGERRLNVLVTRAREKCVIFSNFKAKDVEIKHNASFGLKALKVLLEYAETKNLRSMEIPGEDAESPFEESVCKFLKNEGYEIHKQVGCAGFRVDVAIIDPKYQGRYLLGIECDGAIYHSSPVARDRDRLRQQVLEGLGWYIYRIWSTDWYRNRAESQKRLLVTIKEFNNKEREIIEEPPALTLDEFEEEIENEEQIEEKIEPENPEDAVQDYQLCQSIEADTSCKLHEKPLRDLAKVIVQIVEIEGPVHIDEVIKRIRTFWGLKKAGKRIKNVIQEAAQLSRRSDQIIIKDNFLFPDNKDITVRRRSGNPPAKIDLICDEEIAEAAKLVIKTQFGTDPKDLTTQVSRLFGFKVARGNTAKRINEVIEKLIKNGELQEMPNGMINIQDSDKELKTSN